MQLPDLSLIHTDLIPASFTRSDIPIDVLRLDKVHPVISGNKWFKLYKYLEMAQRENKKRIVSFGGPWSNHIIAVAAAAKLKGYHSLGFIRGERSDNLSPVLKQCEDWEMELIFLNRQQFDQAIVPADILTEEDLVIPMGGFGLPGMEGASSILNYCDADQYTHICCATGTGTMMAGLITSISEQQKVIGYSAVKNDEELGKNIQALIGNKGNNISFTGDSLFGGFAKYNESLIRFMNEFYTATSIPTDIVYTAKLCYKVISDVREGYFPAGSRILIIHSGGLTGNASLEKGLLIW